MLLEVRQISRHFGGLKAIADLDLEVAEGECRGIIGPNGAGKSTLFNLIAGSLPPSSGSVLFRGREITGLPAHRVAKLGIARTFQQNRSFAGLSARENIITSLEHRGADASPDVPDPDEVIELFGLDAWRWRKPGELPWGVQRRLELARAFARGPSLMLIDEPAAGMNAREVAELADTLRLIHGRGVTILVIDHVMDLVLPLCERITLLHHGAKLCEGTPAEIIADERAVNAYLG